MKIVIILALCIAACDAQEDHMVGGDSLPAGTYVWDILKPALTTDELEANLASKDAPQYPTYSDIPETSFDCNPGRIKHSGFYADVETKCQVFHRCDPDGTMTSYLCANTTVFNQITMVCDFWYNVECDRSYEFYYFANSRLYTDQQLFDTPPKDYIAPRIAAQVASQKVSGHGKTAIAGGERHVLRSASSVSSTGTARKSATKTKSQH